MYEGTLERLLLIDVTPTHTKEPSFPHLHFPQFFFFGQPMGTPQLLTVNGDPKIFHRETLERADENVKIKILEGINLPKKC
jgi:hypothetical protein